MSREAQTDQPVRRRKRRPGGYGEREAGGYGRGRRRDEEARARLRPLGERERPAILLVATAVAAALAVAVVVGTLTSSDLSKNGGSLGGGIFIGVVLAVVTVGMYGRRYWAVLAFEALLAFQVVVATLALVVARTAFAAGLCVAAIAVGGTIFWKLVRVMGRIQAGSRRDG